MNTEAEVGYIKILEPSEVGGWFTVAGVLTAEGIQPVDSVGHGATADDAVQMSINFLTNEAVRLGLKPVVV